MFHNSSFGGRSLVTGFENPAKFSFYRCEFRDGQYFEIYFPRIKDLSNSEHDLRFRPIVLKDGDRDEYECDAFDVDVRLTNSDIGARFVVRESPHATTMYEREQGLGLNLSGSTLSGAIDVRQIRIRWLNLDRVAILNGALYIAPFQLSHQRNWLDHLMFWFASADWGGPLFLERLGNNSEEIRFSSHIRGSLDLPEKRHSTGSLSEHQRVAHFRRLSQQYDDLEKAVGNASHSSWQEDFCHYRSMLYRGIAETREKFAWLMDATTVRFGTWASAVNQMVLAVFLFAAGDTAVPCIQGTCLRHDLDLQWSCLPCCASVYLQKMEQESHWFSKVTPRLR